jgi:hypothetical protein
MVKLGLTKLEVHNFKNWLEQIKIKIGHFNETSRFSDRSRPIAKKFSDISANYVIFKILCRAKIIGF